MAMEMWGIESSRFADIGYDESEHIMRCVFHRGGTWDYYNVSPLEFKRVYDAESPGRAFDQIIKGQKQDERVD